MFSEKATQLLSCKGGRDCQDGDGLACKVISTGTIKITERDGTVRALEAVRYVSEAQYNLISIRMFDDEGCQIQVQQGIVKASQGDMVIQEGKKCGGLYKLKERNSV